MENVVIKPIMVDLTDWVQSGEGWNALTYYHKTDKSLLLKLNSESMTYEQTVTEYKKTKAVYELGVQSPATISLVTDGKRYGILTERFVGKQSFARMLFDQADRLNALAKDMAEAARILHSLQCDTSQFDNVTERLRQEVDSCKWIKPKIKSILFSYADGMCPVTNCIHGDMHPGNLLRTDKGDFWIDFGRFGYGDPDLDYASQYVLAYLAPASMAKWILHIDQKTYQRFLERFGYYYYGEEFHSPETQERLRRAVCLMLGHALAKRPAASLIFGSYVKGNEKITLFLLKLINLIKVK